ncbi:MAG: nitrate reductase [Trebouxia sp. A1-2]|nr:MAG: nitrate reductase [Trebouxia sp. A1-2]
MVGVKHLRPFDDKVFDAGFVYISAYDIWVDPNHAAALAARVPTNVRSKLDDEQRRSLILGRTGRDWPLHETVSVIDRRDECTPDRWIPRHPHLIRLSGRHPFNCETPLQDLVQKGFITPTSLHFVRNHGAVPNISWDTHMLSVTGLVDKPTTFTMADLVTKFDQVTVSATLVCVGNRRKEQNLVKKTKGFSWGASAVGTGKWTGVRLRDVLQKCYVHSYQEGARHVHLNGVQREVPLGKMGCYGTSIPLCSANNAANDVLTPDHGYPVRVIIPGGIGARMIKWLSEVVVSSTESDNWYHVNDNKVLPAGVDEERAAREGFWSNPDFAINELSIQSIITSPTHGELIPLAASTSTTYTVRGYAYSGGGRKVITVEVSLDGGNTWLISRIMRGEEPSEYGKHWCWVFWEVQVPLLSLFAAEELRCRAVDSSNNAQPENLLWNVTGMMSNSHFRVKLQLKADRADQIALHCEHPTKNGAEPGGWMERESLSLQGIKAVSTVSVQFDLTMLTPLHSAAPNKGIPIRRLAAHARPFSGQEAEAEGLMLGPATPP